MTVQRYTAGRATIEAETSGLLRLLDRVSDGAASTFVARAETGLGEVLNQALPLWPVRTG